MSDQAWWEIGMADVRRRAEGLFERMLESRPTDEEWGQLRQHMALLADLREYGRLHTQEDTLVATESITIPLPIVHAAVEDAAEVPAEPEAPAHAEVTTHVGTFVQGLHGGQLITETGLEIPVVEVIATAAQLTHGDQVRAVKEGVFPDGRVKYFFIKLRAVGGTNPDRVESVGFVQVCEYGNWVVKANGLDVLVPAFELRESSAAAGDVVTVAYMAPEIRDGRVRGTVVRVHASEQEEVAAAQQPRQVRRVDNPEPERLEWEPTVRFGGRPRVMIVGGRNWPFYRDGISRLGGEPAYIDAFANDRNLNNAIAGADIVVVISSYCSHSRYDKVKAVAKLRGRLFYATNKENWTGLRAFFEQEIIPAWNAHALVAAD